MTKAVRDIATLALMGLVIGIMLGIHAAGGYATWAVGGDLANIGFGTIFAFAPSSLGAVTEPFPTAMMVGGAVALAVTVATPAIGFRRELTSHGSARWATTAEMRQAGLRAPLGKITGPIYGKLGRPRSRADYITSSEIPHSLVAAPTGSGKGRWRRHPDAPHLSGLDHLSRREGGELRQNGAPPRFHRGQGLQVRAL